MGAGLAEQTLKQFADNVTKSGQSNLRQHIKVLLKAMEQAGQGYAQRNYGKNGLRVRTGHLKQPLLPKCETSYSIWLMGGTIPLARTSTKPNAREKVWLQLCQWEKLLMW